MELTAKHWTLTAVTVAVIATITLGAGHLIVEAIAATGIGTPSEITRLLARGN